MKNLKLLYTDIGRGHPFYLDGIVEELHRDSDFNSSYSNSSVFTVATGLSLKCWQLVKYLYTQSGSGSVISRIYKLLRKSNDYNKDSSILKLLGRDISRKYLFDMTPLVVAHPILVSILKKRKKLYYQHGELITPIEAVVGGAEYVFVPTESAAEPFLSHYSKEQVIVTGLCVEPAIHRIAEDSYHKRIERLISAEPLTGCFISSGAEPLEHVKIIVNSLLSHLRGNGKVFLFVKRNGVLEKQVQSIINSNEFEILMLDSLREIPDILPQLTILSYSSRQNENKLTSYFFQNFDFFVSPSHERSNWAVGLGLPLFITDPPVGPFAPLNRKYLLDAQVAVAIENESDANQFALRLKNMHIEGKLKQMSENGWGKHPINGFQKIVSFIKNNS